MRPLPRLFVWPSLLGPNKVGVRPWLWAVLVLLRHFPSLLSAAMFLLVMGATLVFPLRWCSSSAEQWVRDGSLWWKSRASHRVPDRKCSVLVWSSQKAALRLWVNKLLHNAFFLFYFECFIQKPISEARLSWHTLWEAGAGRLPQTILGSFWNIVLRGEKVKFQTFSFLNLCGNLKQQNTGPRRASLTVAAFWSECLHSGLWP